MKPMHINYLMILLWISILCGCFSSNKNKEYPQVGKIERISLALDNIIDPNAKIEVLSEGHGWSEGPIWLEAEQKLLYTDVGHQKIYQWSEEDSVSVYLDLRDPKDSIKNRQGPSALLIDQENRLVILRYGHGEVVKMKSPLNAPSYDFSIVADRYNGKRFNNTNDAAFHSSGLMIMSDPPSKLEDALSPAIYSISPAGVVNLITDSLSSPNGIAFSPDERTIYIANADRANAIWVEADVDEQGNISNGRKFFDATGYNPMGKVHPDGLKINSQGVIFATGPGGIYILSPEGTHLGTILNDQFNTNCVLDNKEEALYITAGPYLMRVKLKGTVDI